MFDMSKPFVLIEKEGVITAYQGILHQVGKIADIESIAQSSACDVVFVLPYCAIKERGFEAQGDEPILVLQIESTATLDAQDLPDDAIDLSSEITPSLDDQAYAELIAQFQQEAIEKGHCAQATISRKFSGRIKDFSVQKALSLYKRLLSHHGHYMTALFFYQGQCLIAGTPERHLEIAGDKTIMTPIAGTFRKGDHTSLPDFLQDPKEINELFQVVDEEMKMMSVICPEGGAIEGPYLRETSSVIHTEYNLVGQRSLRAMDALRHSLHAPTVTGSPLESAARQIKRFEPESRRYYAGEIGIYKPAQDELDCAILLRGAEIFADGFFHVQAGGGIVRNSDPWQEVQESRAKANGILKALTGQLQAELQIDEKKKADIEPLLKARNSQLSSFWQAEQQDHERQENFSCAVTIINNEDDFAFMLAHMLRVMGASNVEVVDTFDFDPDKDTAELVLLGPGPGDPTDMTHPRMRRLQEIIAALQLQERALLGICLGHQALAFSLGLEVTRQDESSQGMPRTVTISGKQRTLAFYNSFSPLHSKDIANIEIDCDEKDRIIAMRGPNFTGYQFHPESAMSVDGWSVLKEAVQHYATA